MTNWLFWQMAGVGPMQGAYILLKVEKAHGLQCHTGQANHFVRYTQEPVQYGIDRYQNEVRRLYRVLDKHLQDSGTDYIVGNKCTIADISIWPWVTLSRWCKIELDEFPAVKAWEERHVGETGG
jgi:glutathione S-transferase